MTWRDIFLLITIGLCVAPVVAVLVDVLRIGKPKAVRAYLLVCVGLAAVAILIEYAPFTWVVFTLSVAAVSILIDGILDLFYK